MAKEIEQSADEQYALIRLILLVGGAMIFVAMVGGALTIARSITRPLRSLTAAMTVLATGGHSVSIPAPIAMTKSAKCQRCSGFQG